MATLCNQYNGHGEVTKRYNKAKELLTHLHYKNKLVLPWLEFNSQLTEAFIACKKAGKPLHAQTKMDYLMEKTQSVELAAAKEVAHATHPNNFAAVANYIGERVSEIFLAAVQNRACLQGAHGRGNNRHCVSATGTTGGRSGNRGRRGGCGGCGCGNGHGKSRGLRPWEKFP